LEVELLDAASIAPEIQMGHCKCEKDDITCPIYHRGQLLASYIVDRRSSEVGRPYWSAVTF